jgi:hypothetical protein
LVQLHAVLYFLNSYFESAKSFAVYLEPKDQFKYHANEQLYVTNKPYHDLVEWVEPSKMFTVTHEFQGIVGGHVDVAGDFTSDSRMALVVAYLENGSAVGFLVLRFLSLGCDMLLRAVESAA